ncbi:hypothetical protein C240_73 [Enterococcus sp. 5H]|nr:hypothetical protein [Enterococcus sp. 5H]
MDDVRLSIKMSSPLIFSVFSLTFFQKKEYDIKGLFTFLRR